VVSEGPDFSVARVAQLYQSALQGSAQTEPAQAYVKFCMRVGLLDEADAALRELVRRDKEKPEPLVRYGDFLVEVKKDTQGALEQYRQALIWSPDDQTVKSKIADIYINMGIESYSKLQYAGAEARFNDALKYVADPKSPQGLKIQDYMGKLGAIRKLPTH
jgi:tetratricopeptide (TPR) repeat protein